MVLASLNLHPCSDRMSVSLTMSCRDAVARLIAWRVTRGLKPCSAETSEYALREELRESILQEVVAV
jgi:hypothetical protein